jgi:hypothetical protein
MERKTLYPQGKNKTNTLKADEIQKQSHSLNPTRGSTNMMIAK